MSSTSSNSATHRRPGGCGRRVADHLFACKLDWFRLPHVLRAAVTSAWTDGDGTAHVQAMAEATRWFGYNPRQAPAPRLSQPRLF